MWHRPALAATLCAGLAIALGGCAGRADVEALRDDVDALERAHARTAADATEALLAVRGVREELAAVRAAVDAAGRDAARTRELVEALDRRLADAPGGAPK